MACFTNQFAVKIPFEFIGSLEHHRDLHAISDELSKLLHGRSEDWLTSVATQIDQAIDDAVAHRRFVTPGPCDDLIADGRFKNLDPSVQRHLYGEFTLLCDLEESHDWSRYPIKTKKWERFAVFSLWMLADAIWLDTNRENTGSGNLLYAVLPTGDYSTVKYMLASIRALQIAQSLLLGAYEVSKQNRTNGIKANPNSEINRLRALEIAEELPFRSMNKAAEHIALVLVKSVTKNGIDTYYTIEWIKGWLRDAGWKPKHKRINQE